MQQDVRLKAHTARELMTADPVTVESVATIREASSVMSERHFSALPVVDVSGMLVGVISQSDVVRALAEQVDYVLPGNGDAHEGIEMPNGERVHAGYVVEEDRTAMVSTVMTPKIFAVGPESPALEVVATMLQRDVHRVFVVDDEGLLVGVITAMDILRHLWA